MADAAAMVTASWYSYMAGAAHDVHSNRATGISPIQLIAACLTVCHTKPGLVWATLCDPAETEARCVLRYFSSNTSGDTSPYNTSQPALTAEH